MKKEVDNVNNSNQDYVEIFSYFKNNIEYFTPHEPLAEKRTEVKTYNVYTINLKEFREEKNKR